MVEVTIKKVIHATNICGIESLIKKEKDDYLCCSSLDCKDFFHREVLFVIKGNVVREYNGDIGSIGMTPKKTNYDELHIEGDYEVLGLYVSENTEDFTLENIAKAKSYINCILELPIEIIGATDNQLQEIARMEEEIENLPEDEYIEAFKTV